MSHIFISHSHDDSVFVQELAKELSSARILYWLDTDFLYAGDYWEKEIDTAIENALAVLLVMSPSAKQSEYVTYEWAYAFGVGTKIIPIYLETVEWHPKLDPSKIQYIDFRKDDKPYSELIANLLRLQNPNNLPEESEYLNRNKHLALQGENEQSRKNAIENIVKYDDEQVPDILVEISETARLIDSKTFAAIRLAEKFADARAISGLVVGISKNNPYQSRAVTVIQTFGEKAVDGLIELLDAEWSEARYEAVRILGNWKVEKVANKFLQMLEMEETNKVYAQLATAMVQLEDKRAIRYLTDAIMLDQYINNTQVVEALCAFNDEQSIPALLRALRISSYNRQIIGKTLINLGEAVKPYLVQELNAECSERDDFYLANLLEIVESLPDGDFYDIAVKFVDCKYPYTHTQAIMALGAIGDARCIPKIGTFLNEATDAEKAWAYILALGKIDNINVYPYIMESMKNFPIHVRRILKYKLYHNHKNALITLVDLLYHNDVSVVDDALETLRQSENPEALSAVKEWEQKQAINNGDDE